MAKKCVHCGFKVDDDEKIFCPKCGELMDKKLNDTVNLINEIDKTIDKYQKSGVQPEKYKKQTPVQNTPSRSRRRDDDDDYDNISKVSRKPAKKSTSSALIIIIIIIVIAVILGVILLK